MTTFADIVALWLEDAMRRMDLQLSTKRMYERISEHLRGWGATIDACDVDLSGYVAERAAHGLTQRTLRLELRVASAAYNWGSRRRILPANAGMYTPRIRMNPAIFYCNRRTPSAAEAAAAVDAMAPGDWKLAVLLMARTGARVGEIVSLRRCDIDVRGGRLALGTVPGARKTGLRWFPLDEDSLRLLTPRAEASEDRLLDLGNSRAPIQNIQRRLRAACTAAGVPQFSPQGLRRMVVTRLLRAGVDPGTAAALTGHSVQVMLRHYQQVTDDDRRRAADRAKLGILTDDVAAAAHLPRAEGEHPQFDAEVSQLPAASAPKPRASREPRGDLPADRSPARVRPALRERCAPIPRTWSDLALRATVSLGSVQRGGVLILILAANVARTRLITTAEFPLDVAAVDAEGRAGNAAAHRPNGCQPPDGHTHAGVPRTAAFEVHDGTDPPTS